MMAYVARHVPCGLIVAVTIDDPDYRKYVAKDIAAWVRRGDTIERMPVEDARKAEFCLCFRKKRGPAHDPAEVDSLQLPLLP